MTVKIAATGLVLWAALGCPLLCLAQDAGTTPATAGDKTPAAPPEQKTDATEPAPQADLVLLARAMKGLSSTNSFFYEGDVEVKGEGKGLKFTARERVRFTAKRPGKVYSDVMVSLGDAPSGKRYVTVSDGINVWVQRPGTRQYSVNAFDATEFTRNLTGFGIMGSLYLNRDLLSGIGMITSENAAQFTELLKKENIDLAGAAEVVDGVSTPVYTLSLTKQNMVFRFFVDPRQAVIQRLEVTAQDKGIDFTMIETVVRQKPAPPLTKGQFLFVPPTDHTKTKSIAVELL